MQEKTIWTGIFLSLVGIVYGRDYDVTSGHFEDSYVIHNHFPPMDLSSNYTNSFNKAGLFKEAEKIYENEFEGFASIQPHIIHNTKLERYKIPFTREQILPLIFLILSSVSFYLICVALPLNFFHRRKTINGFGNRRLAIGGQCSEDSGGFGEDENDKGEGNRGAGVGDGGAGYSESNNDDNERKPDDGNDGDGGGKAKQKQKRKHGNLINRDESEASQNLKDAYDDYRRKIQAIDRRVKKKKYQNGNIVEALQEAAQEKLELQDKVTLVITQLLKDLERKLGSTDLPLFKEYTSKISFRPIGINQRKKQVQSQMGQGNQNDPSQPHPDQNDEFQWQPGHNDQSQWHPDQNHQFQWHPGQNNQSQWHPGPNNQSQWHPDQNHQFQLHPGPNDQFQWHPGPNDQFQWHLGQNDQSQWHPGQHDLWQPHPGRNDQWKHQQGENTPYQRQQGQQGPLTNQPWQDDQNQQQTVSDLPVSHLPVSQVQGLDQPMMQGGSHEDSLAKPKDYIFDIHDYIPPILTDSGAMPLSAYPPLQEHSFDEFKPDTEEKQQDNRDDVTSISNPHFWYSPVGNVIGPLQPSTNQLFSGEYENDTREGNRATDAGDGDAEFFESNNDGNECHPDDGNDGDGSGKGKPKQQSIHRRKDRAKNKIAVNFYRARARLSAAEHLSCARPCETAAIAQLDKLFRRFSSNIEAINRSTRNARKEAGIKAFSEEDKKRKEKLKEKLNEGERAVLSNLEKKLGSKTSFVFKKYKSITRFGHKQKKQALTQEASRMGHYQNPPQPPLGQHNPWQNQLGEVNRYELQQGKQGPWTSQLWQEDQWQQQTVSDLPVSHLPVSHLPVSQVQGYDQRMMQRGSHEDFLAKPKDYIFDIDDYIPTSPTDIGKMPLSAYPPLQERSLDEFKPYTEQNPQDSREDEQSNSSLDFRFFPDETGIGHSQPSMLISQPLFHLPQQQQQPQIQLGAYQSQHSQLQIGLPHSSSSQWPYPDNIPQNQNIQDLQLNLFPLMPLHQAQQGQESMPLQQVVAEEEDVSDMALIDEIIKEMENK